LQPLLRVETNPRSREEHLNELLAKAPLYIGEMCISNIDAIIRYYRNAQAVKAEVDNIYKQILETERNILLIMRHFEIPPGTVLYGEIPFELEYEIWADENDQLTITKINSLQPEEDDPNVIVIKFGHGKNYDVGRKIGKVKK